MVYQRKCDAPLQTTFLRHLSIQSAKVCAENRKVLKIKDPKYEYQDNFNT